MCTQNTLPVSIHAVFYKASKCLLSLIHGLSLHPPNHKNLHSTVRETKLLVIFGQAGSDSAPHRPGYLIVIVQAHSLAVTLTGLYAFKPDPAATSLLLNP